MAGSLGTIFAEIDIDPSRFQKSGQRLFKDATSVSLSIEDNFRKMGIKSSASFDLMRQKAMNAFEMIANSSKATANDIIRAEKAKNDQLQRLNDQQYGVQQSFISKLKSNWLGFSAVAVASIYSIRRVVDSLSDMVKKSEEQRKAVMGMETAMRSMGRYSPEMSDKLQDFASSLQGVTNYGDEATLGGVKFLMTYRAITDGLMPRSIVAMQDLAALMGGGPGGLTSAANMLGKASMGMTGELRRVGITVDAATFASKGYVGVLKEIEDQVHGQARAMADPWSQLKNTISDSKEALGGFISIAFEDYAQDMIHLLPQMSKSWKEVAKSIDETRRVEARYMIEKLQQQLKGVYETGAELGGLGPSFTITGITESEKAAIEAKMKGYQDIIDQIAAKNKPKLGGVVGGIDPQAAKEAQDITDKLWAYEVAAAVKADNEMMDAYGEYIGYAGKMRKQDLADAEKASADKAGAYRSMYKDMKQAHSLDFEFQDKLLQKQRDEYINLTHDKNTADKWYDDQHQKLQIKEAQKSDDFFRGIKAGFDDLKLHEYTWGQAGYDTVKKFADYSTVAIAGFIDPTKDSFFDLGNAAKGVFDGMVSEWSKMIARMVAEWAASEISQYFTGIPTGGSSGGGIFGGIYDIGSSILGGVGDFLGGLFHEGGMVAHSGGYIPERPMIAHSGMYIPPIKSDERHIIAQTGEGILSRLGMAALGGPSNLSALNKGQSPDKNIQVAVKVYFADNRLKDLIRVESDAVYASNQAAGTGTRRRYPRMMG